MTVLRRCLILGLVLSVLVGLAAPLLADADCGCCGGKCEAGCCMLAARAGFAIGHPTSERPHWKPPLEVRAKLPCVVVAAAAAVVSPLAADSTRLPAAHELQSWSGSDDSLALGLSPSRAPATPRGPPLLSV